MEAQFRTGQPLPVTNYTPASAIAAGEVVVIGNAAFVAHDAIAANTPGTLYAGGGIYRLTAGEAIATGMKVYWNNTTNKVVETANGNIVLGVVCPGSSAAADGDAIDVIHLQDTAGSTPAAVVAALTDSTGGTANDTLTDVGASFSQSALNNNFADVAGKLNAILTALKNAGLMKTS